MNFKGRSNDWSFALFRTYPSEYGTVSYTHLFVVPDNQRFIKDVFVPLERSKGAVTGHKVVVELTKYGGDNKKPEGKIVEIIGHVNDPGTDIMSIVKGYDLPIEFPEKVLNQAERVAKDVSTADMACLLYTSCLRTLCRQGLLHPVQMCIFCM